MGHLVLRTVRWLFGAMLFACILGVAQPAAAQTPDSQTPAEETICLKLKFATPGLYGLCVAYCESHDAELDAITGMPKPSPVANKKILENYNKKKQPSDPEMPCVKPPCPCFNAEDLANLDPKSAGFCVDATGETHPSITFNPKGTCKNYAQVSGLTCSLVKSSGDRCETVVATQQEITLDQFKVCADLIRAEAARRGVSCSVSLPGK